MPVGLPARLCYTPLLCQTAKHVVQMSSYGSSIYRILRMKYENETETYKVKL